MSDFELPEALRAPKPATPATIAANDRVRRALPFEDTRSFDNARRGFIATLDPLKINRADGRAAYDLSSVGFLDGDCADTVNPSLWRQAQLNAQHHGLFEVVDGIYQVRSFDIANMTLIRGETGWVVIDPLTSAESARAALDLANTHLGARPVTAVVHTHSHVDHFAGILGVVDAEDIESGRIPCVAPRDFVEEALAENVLAGNVMGRRATYMYGNLLKPGPHAFVSTGLGAALSMGSTGFVVPNDIVSETGERRVLDGVEFEFQMTMGTEAPSEFVFYLPAFRALCMSEITSHHLHNVYTLRGAQVRDALAWASQIDESIELFGDRLDVHFASHHWPIWGRGDAIDYLEKQRDLYKYIHDQTLRLANHGYTKDEIAEQIDLPDALGLEFSNRGYYGSVHHNARAVYVKYLGFFDGNPSTLHRHPPAAAGRRYVDAIGGEDRVVAIARAAFDEGDYRWVAELLNHVMMTNPGHVAARALLADALEQMGYQAESAPWRNFYLCGALELRHGVPTGSKQTVSEGIARGMPIDNVFQAMAVRLNAARADGLTLRLNVRFTDTGGTYLVQVHNSVLNFFGGRVAETADATLALGETEFKRMMLGVVTAADLVGAGSLAIDGDADALATFAGCSISFRGAFRSSRRARKPQTRCSLWDIFTARNDIFGKLSHQFRS